VKIQKIIQKPMVVDVYFFSLAVRIAISGYLVRQFFEIFLSEDLEDVSC